MRDTTLLLIGTGAVGSLYGGKLSQAGISVSAVCRSDYDVVKQRGIKVKSILGDFQFHPRNLYHSPLESSEKYDYVLVALKVLPEIDLPALLRHVVGPNTVIVLLQNGVAIEEAVFSAFPENEIISGLAFVCVNRTAPGEIDHLDYGRVVIGNYPRGVSEKTKFLADAFKKAGVDCRSTETVIQSRWQKLVWNAPFNPMSVLGGGVNTKEILEDPENIGVVKGIMQEVCRLAEAEGFPLPEGIVEQNIENTLVMKPYKTSMLLDFESRRPLETEAILGNAVRIAKKHSISVPRMECLYALLKMADRKNLLGIK